MKTNSLSQKGMMQRRIIVKNQAIPGQEFYTSLETLQAAITKFGIGSILPGQLVYSTVNYDALLKFCFEND